MNDLLDNDLIPDSKRDLSGTQFYRDFMDVEEAKEFGKFLDSHNITYALETTDTILDSAIVGNGLLPNAVLKLFPRDFKVVNELRAEVIRQLDYTDVQEHYLAEFDDEELKDIFENQEDWNIEDIEVAKLLLNERGVAVDENEITKMRSETLEDASKGKEGSQMWITIYSFCIILGAFFGYLFLIAGFGMAIYYGYSRKTDLDGNRYFTYDKVTRRIGKVMLYGGALIVIIEFCFLFYFFTAEY